MNDWIVKPNEYKKYMDWMKARCKQSDLTFGYDDFLYLWERMIKEGIIKPEVEGC
jgi:hypothetical protein